MLTTLAVALSLTVPYLPQTDALCGGAAAAMVFRFWGDTHADITPFAPLVDKRAGGIADDVLVRAIEERGWRPRRFVGSITLLAEQIGKGRPVMILLADRGPLNHYVVVTGVEAEAVVIHDPAWGPGRHIPFTDLMRAWRPTNFWALEILPPAGGPPAREPPAASLADRPTTQVSATPDRCDRLLNDAVDAARARPADADTLLATVRAQCPASAGPLREMAGVRFSERRWREAADLAERTLTIEPHDDYTWELLASSRFLQDDLPGALRAWNQIGKPLINLVRIEGVTHARFQVISAVVGLQPNMVLSERAFRLAGRRLEELPDRTAARLTFQPEPDGFVTVTVALAERQAPPRGAAAWAVAGLQTAVDREVRAAIPGWTGQAELWSASWRWWDGRPRVAFTFALPRTGRQLPGVWRLDAGWESQDYTAHAPDGLAAPFAESRSHGGLTVSDWLTPNLRYSVTAGADTWRGSHYSGRTVFAGRWLERRWLSDRVAVAASTTAWAPLPFQTSALRATYRSSHGAAGWVFAADAGVDRASDAAPLGVWPGAGDGHSRELLTRAHPLLKSGVINLDTRSVFGRTVVYAHGEVQRWFAPGRPVRPAVAIFADLARASRRRPSEGDELRNVAQADLGTGLRLRIPGASGTARLDFAHGLRDGADAITLGWQF